MPRVTTAMVAGGRTVAEPRLSPDGRQLAFVVTEDGRSRLVLVDAAGGAERVLTTDPAPVAGRALGGGAFDWLPDGSGLVFAGRAGGIHVVGVGGGPARLVAEAARATAPTVSPDGRRVAYQLEAAHVAVVELDGGAWPVRVGGDGDFVMDPAWAPDGITVAWQEWSVPHMPWDESRISTALASGGSPSRPLVEGAGVQLQQPRWSPDGSHLAYLSDDGGWLNLTVLDLRTGATAALDEPHEHGGPTWGPGQRSFCWSPDGTALAVCRNETGFGSLLVWEPGSAPRQVARAVHGGLSWQGDRLAAVRTGGRTPTQVVVYEGAELAERRTVAFGPVAFGAAPLPEPELVTWPADDGVEIPGRLYRAEGEAGPVICWVHGGPTDQWQVEWRPRFSWWLDRGWSILVPDHRGSTGHGRAFTQALAGRWGELDVADVAAGIRAIGPRGWGDPRRVAIMGGSAGGFTVLNVLASHPGLCAAGVDLYGVADLFGLAEIDYRYEAHYPHSLVGPLPEAAGRYRDRSPVHRAEAIVDPLLVLQGSDDEVVPVAQSEAIAARLRALGRTVELHVYEGEGHGWGRADTVTDELARTEEFLRRHVLRWRSPTP